MYPQNMTLAVCFWVLLGVVMHGITLRTKTFTFDHSPRAGFFAMIGFVTMAVSMVTIAFATLSKYRADVAFAQAVNMNRGGQAIDDVIAKLDDAASANRWSDVYYRNLAHALLQKVNDVAKESTADSGEIKALIGAAVNASVRATELSPSTVTNWDMRGDTYRAVSPFVADAAVFAVSAYETAVRLAPTNPRYLVDLARGHIAYADVLAPIVQGEDEEKSVQATQIQNDALQKATEALLSAIALKSDYADARYYLASVQERQEKLADAIASMELVRVGAPTDIGVGLQLALLYLRQGKNELAKNELNRVLALAPNFSNAHWYLAAMLEKENDIDGALKELEIIMEIDPENETVQKKIDALRAGTRTQAPVPDPLPATEPTALPDENSTP
jgi:tetratricopeptide (TPR) repeat protein